MQQPPSNPNFPNWQQEQPQQPYSQQQPPQYQQPWQGQYPNLQALPPVQPIVKKKRRTGLFIGLGVLVVVLAICAIIGTAMSNAASNVATTTTTTTSNTTTQQQQQSAPTGTWKTTHTFSGNGAKKTSTFTIGSDWKIIWSCKPSSFYGGQYNMIVSVTGSDGIPVDPAAVNSVCKVGNTGDTTEEHSGGDVFLDVNSEGSWNITIQELK